MTDIVERLRHLPQSSWPLASTTELRLEAADEIERLREESDMPVPPDEITYGNVTDYDAQVIEWLKEERANLFSRLAEVEAENERLRNALRKIADLIDTEAGEPLDDAINIAEKALGK